MIRCVRHHSTQYQCFSWELWGWHICCDTPPTGSNAPTADWSLLKLWRRGAWDPWNWTRLYTPCLTMSHCSMPSFVVICSIFGVENWNCYHCDCQNSVVQLLLSALHEWWGFGSSFYHPKRLSNMTRGPMALWPQLRTPLHASCQRVILTYWSWCAAFSPAEQHGTPMNT